MGMNSVLLIRNDGLEEIEKDVEFGKKIALSIREGRKGTEIASGHFCNVAQLVVVHHADDLHLILSGRNNGEDLGWDKDINVIRKLAFQIGYKLVKRK